MMDKEDLVQYGTPLQALDEDTARTSKAPRLSDQIVTDKQGRRRFHGAFTGGFSAGFFNSVGTKEGWTPSTFVSSRSKRKEKSSQNDPTTYMDDEDLDSFGIAAQRIQATSDYEDPRKQTKRKRMDDWRGPIPGKPVLEDLLKPVNVTVGMKLLMKLGWRPGQGIGPRISSLEKRRTRRERGRLHGGDAPGKGADSPSSESEEENVDVNSLPLMGASFAPDDVQSTIWKAPKSDFFGLGYKPLERGNVLGSRFQPLSLELVEKKKRISIKGQAFGVGAFEDDDEDIYSKEDMSDYDFALGPSAGDRRQKGSSRWEPDIRALQETLEGFRLSLDPLPKANGVLLPILPPDFQPWHQCCRRRFERKEEKDLGRPSCEDRLRMVSNPPSVEIRTGVKTEARPTSGGQGPTSASRSSFLSTFMEASGGGEAPPSTSVAPPSAASDLKMKPFASNPEKQKRFEAYMEAEGKDLGGVFPVFMTEWEREREKEEFARAAGLKKPLFSISISSRFTSGSFDDGPTKGFIEGFNNMKDIAAAKKSTTGKAAVPEEETREDVKAAQMKMFGHLTQTKGPWHPDKTVCKRFNVPNPFPLSTSVGVPSTGKEKMNIFNFLSDTSTSAARPELKPRGGIMATDRALPPLQATEEEKENYGLKVPVSDPPTLDLFKAIFEDSSSSDTDDDQPGRSTRTESASWANKSENDKGMAVMSNVKRDQDRKTASEPALSESEMKKRDLSETLNIPPAELDPSYIASKAKGVFKGIDFTALNEYRVAGAVKTSTTENGAADEAGGGGPSHSRVAPREKNERGWRHKGSSSSSSDSDSDSSGHKGALSILLDDEYGPELPPAQLRGGKSASAAVLSKPSSFDGVHLSKSLLHFEEKKKKRGKHKYNKQKKKAKKKKKKKDSKRHK